MPTGGGESPPGTPTHEPQQLPFGSPFEASCGAAEGLAGGQPTCGAAGSSAAAPGPAAELGSDVTAAGLAAGPPAPAALLSIRTSHASSGGGGAALGAAAASGSFRGLTSARGSGGVPELAWGWLQPGRPGLPHVLLQGKGVALGRGKEAYEERLPLLLLASPPASPTKGGGQRRTVSADAVDSAVRGSSSRRQQRACAAFVEVADGRVSRLHCWVTRGRGGEAVLEDCSSNGTFLNGRRMQRGSWAPLREGDRVSLVLSVAPLAEQYFIYHSGDPRVQAPDQAADWIDAASRAWLATPGSSSPTSGGSPRKAAARANLTRSKTSTYTTAETTTLEDLSCCLCLGTLRGCVALEPCGHCFCATCLSHHFAALLGSGQALACPLRCTPPERVVANPEVRRLVELRTASFRQQQQQQGEAAVLPTLHEAPSGASSAGGEGAGSAGGGGDTTSTAGAAAPAAEQPPSQQLQQPSPFEEQSSGPEGVAAAAATGAEPGPSSGQPPSEPGPPEQQSPPPISLTATSSAGEADAAAGAGAAGAAQAAAAGPSVWEEMEAEGEDELGMHPLCPLHDELLPLDASGLKHKQLSYSVEQLQKADGPAAAMAAMEALARLGWSDDAVRGEIAALGGIESMVAAMNRYPGDDGVCCNGCLALMALVRGEGEVSNANKWRVAKAEGVECVVAALRTHRDQPMVQLSALLCIVPLALENPYLQAKVCELALQDILLAMRHHPDEAEVVGKAMVALGVLGQGEEEVHDIIRDCVMSSSAPRAIAGALRTLGCISEEVLWAALFALAVVVRDSSPHYVQHMLTLAAAGVGPALREAMVAYRQDVEAQGTEPDEMILKAGDFLADTLGRAEHLLRLRRRRRVYAVLLAAGCAVLCFRALRRLRASWHRRGSGRAAA